MVAAAGHMHRTEVAQEAEGTEPRCRARLKELAAQEEVSAALTATWASEKEKLGLAADLKGQLDEARNELAIAQRKGEFQRAGELAYGLIPDLERKLAEAEAQEDDRSSMVEETGDESAGDERPGSSVSDCRAPSSDAAKLLEISGSDTTAYEDCVDVVDIEEVVRSLAEIRDVWGSSCHKLFGTSIPPYN